MRLGIATAVLVASISLSRGAGAKPFEEYIKATPTVAPLSSATWGVTGDPGVVPRDISNGIESAKGAGVHPDYYYWDGEIIKATDGKYHMFMSTFSGNTNFGGGWLNSDAYHAISQTNVLGPYVRQDYVYNSGGSSPHKGHNVSAAQLSDGSYVVVVSEIVPFTLYKSSSLDGPWTGCSPQTDVGGSNISFIERHDGKFEITERSGGLAVADTLCGHYVRQQPKTTYSAHSNSVYPVRTSIPGVSNPSYAYEEDPHIWRSGGTYHIIYSGSGDRVGWHVYSPDGLTGWKDNGYAWSGRDYKKIFCYDGTTTCTAWYKMERPGVVLEDGHPTHVTWAVSDVDKDNQVLPGTNHGTKVIVVPFDGVAFDNDFGTGGGGTGAGGTTGGGGRSGGGGATGAGGATSTSGKGGSTGSGGATSLAGASGTGTGGGSGTGGLTGTGGVMGGTGGASATGGSAGSATGGTVGTGGKVSGSGGTSTALGGTPGGNGGISGGFGGSGHGGTTSTGTPPSSSDSGCSCALGDRTRNQDAGSPVEPVFLLALGALALLRRGLNRRSKF